MNLVYRVFEMPMVARWAPTSYKWKYNPYRMASNKWITGLKNALKVELFHPHWPGWPRGQRKFHREAEGLSDVKEQLNAMPLFGADGQMPGRFCTLTDLRGFRLDCGWHWFWQISKVGYIQLSS